VEDLPHCGVSGEGGGNLKARQRAAQTVTPASADACVVLGARCPRPARSGEETKTLRVGHCLEAPPQQPRRQSPSEGWHEGTVGLGASGAWLCGPALMARAAGGFPDAGHGSWRCGGGAVRLLLAVEGAVRGRPPALSGCLQPAAAVPSPALLGARAWICQRAWSCALRGA